MQGRERITTRRIALGSTKVDLNQGGGVALPVPYQTVTVPPW